MNKEKILEALNKYPDPVDLGRQLSPDTLIFDGKDWDYDNMFTRLNEIIRDNIDDITKWLNNGGKRTITVKYAEHWDPYECKYVKDIYTEQIAKERNERTLILEFKRTEEEFKTDFDFMIGNYDYHDDEEVDMEEIDVVECDYSYLEDIKKEL